MGKAYSEGSPGWRPATGTAGLDKALGNTLQLNFPVLNRFLIPEGFLHRFVLLTSLNTNKT